MPCGQPFVEASASGPASGLVKKGSPLLELLAVLAAGAPPAGALALEAPPAPPVPAATSPPSW
jgi:hypothetical protein